MTLIAAGAAAAGVLGTASLAAAAPLSQSAGDAATAATATTTALTVQGGPQANSGQSGALFDVITNSQSAGTPSATTSTPARHQAAQPAAAQHAAKPAAAKAAAAKPAAAKPAAAKPAPAKPAAAKPAAVKHQPPAAPAKPYTIYDSVTPGSIPSGQPAAVYADGAYAASASQMAGHKSVLWIDTNGSDTNANVLDVEPGDATPAGAAQWVQQKLSAHHDETAIVYTMRSDWQAVQDDVAGLPHWMQDKVQYWIADPTGVPHIVPGATATQWYWGSNYDLTTAAPNFAQ